MNTTVKVTVYEWHPDQFDFGFTDGDGQFVFLNWNLAQEKNLTWKQMQEIMRLHTERVDVFKQMKKTKSLKKLIKLAIEIEQIEYRLQDAWKFERNRVSHTHWNRIPECMCKNYPGGERFFDSSCRIHQSEEWQVIEKLSRE